MPENYGLMTNMAQGIREGMNTYMTLKNQQRQETQLDQHLKNQQQDQQMKMMMSGMTQNPEGGGLMFTPEAEKQRSMSRGIIENNFTKSELEKKQGQVGTAESDAEIEAMN